MTAAAIYCRISSDKTGEAAGVERQLEDCRDLATTLGWPVVGEYLDNDISATSGKTRPRYQAMLAAIAAGEVDAIVTWAPDRLYRKLSDLEPLIEIMEAADAALRTVRAGEIDMSTPTGRMLARILASVSTAEGEVKADRWKRSIRQRRENGQSAGWGPRPFGYTHQDTIVEAEATALRWAANEIISGASVTQVVDRLNEQGHTSTLGNPFRRTSLRKILSNPRYAGHSTLRGVVVGEGAWPPIFDDETFANIQASLAVRRAHRGSGSYVPRPRVGLLLGIIYCGRCGNRMMSGRNNSPKKGQDERPRVYRCKKGGGLPGCGLSVQADWLEEMAEAYAQTRLDDPMVREQLALLSASAGVNVAEIMQLETRLRELEAQLSEPGVPVATLTLAMDRTRERIETLSAAGVEPTHIPDTWPTDLTRRARLVRLAIANIEVGPAPVRGRRAFQPERVQITPR